MAACPRGQYRRATPAVASLDPACQRDRGSAWPVRPGRWPDGPLGREPGQHRPASRRRRRADPARRRGRADQPTAAREARRQAGRRAGRPRVPENPQARTWAARLDGREDHQGLNQASRPPVREEHRALRRSSRPAGREDRPGGRQADQPAGLQDRPGGRQADRPAGREDRLAGKRADRRTEVALVPWALAPTAWQAMRQPGPAWWRRADPPVAAVLAGAASRFAARRPFRRQPRPARRPAWKARQARPRAQRPTQQRPAACSACGLRWHAARPGQSQRRHPSRPAAPSGTRSEAQPGSAAGIRSARATVCSPARGESRARSGLRAAAGRARSVCG
jgi:hypothetical protein